MLCVLLFSLLSTFGVVGAFAETLESDPCGAASSEDAPKAAPPKVFHYVFLIDTSRSMIGEGDGKGRILLPRVKAEIAKFLDQIPPGSRVTLHSFDDGPKVSQTFDIPQQKAEAARYLQGIEAKGKRTCIYRSLKHVLGQWPGDSQTGVMVFLLTDGNNNCPPPPTLEEVAQEYRLRRGPYDWLYYLLLGLEVSPELESALQHEEGWKLLAVPPDKVPRLPVVTVEPKQLELGNLEREQVARREIQVRVAGEEPGSLRLRVRAVSPDLGPHGSALTVTPEVVMAPGASALSFQLLNRSSLPHREAYRAHLCLESADPGTVMKPVAVPMQFRFYPVGVFRVEPLDVLESLTLEPGTSGSVHYMLKGDQWAKGAVHVAPKEAPEGLRVLVNGKPGGAQVFAGEQFSVQLENVGIQSRAALQPQLAFAYPAETTGPATLMLPRVFRPLTWWEKLLDWWWLSLLLLPLLFLLAATLAARFRPWGELRGTGKPPECPRIVAELRGKRPIDLGKLLREPDLEGIEVGRARRGNFLKVYKISEKHPERRLESEGYPLNENDTFRFGYDVKVFAGEQEVASFKIVRPNQKHTQGEVPNGTA